MVSGRFGNLWIIVEKRSHVANSRLGLLVGSGQHQFGLYIRCHYECHITRYGFLRQKVLD
jgi:hypothetical protein